MKENFLLLVFLILLVAGGYYWYFYLRQPVTADDLSGESVFGREFLTMAVKIKKIDINTDFFQSEQFLFLEDYTPLIEPAKIVGKKNPFLPIILPEESESLIPAGP